MKWTSHQDLKKLREAFKSKHKKAKRKNKKAKTKNKRVKAEPLYNNYKEYLLSKEWKSKRLKILQRSGGVCEICNTKRAYQVHHITYKRVYKENLSDLIAICGICHQAEHNLLTEEQIEEAVDYLFNPK